MKMMLSQILKQVETTATIGKSKTATSGKIVSGETLWKSFLKEFSGFTGVAQKNGKSAEASSKEDPKQQKGNESGLFLMPDTNVLLASNQKLKVANGSSEMTKASVLGSDSSDSAQKNAKAPEKNSSKENPNQIFDKDQNSVKAKPVGQTSNGKIVPGQIIPGQNEIKEIPGNAKVAKALTDDKTVKTSPLTNQPVSKVTEANEKPPVKSTITQAPETVATNKNVSLKDGESKPAEQVKKTNGTPVQNPKSNHPAVPNQQSAAPIAFEMPGKSVQAPKMTKVATAKSEKLSVQTNIPEKPAEIVGKEIKSPETQQTGTAPKSATHNVKAVDEKSTQLPGIQKHISSQTTTRNVNHSNKLYDKAEFTKVTTDQPAQTVNHIADKTPAKNAASGETTDKVQNEHHDAVGTVDSGAIKSVKKDERMSRDQSDISYAKTDHIINPDGVKRDLSAKIVQIVQKEISSEKPDQLMQWQQHKFILNDGKSINLSLKQNDGVLHLQIGSNNAEMNQLLQHHIQDIKTHLQEHFQLEVDLQFQNSGYQGQGNGGNANHQQAAAPAYQSSGSAPGKLVRPEAVSDSSATVRLLGFNRNEWTG